MSARSWLEARTTRHWHCNMTTMHAMQAKTAIVYAAQQVMCLLCSQTIDVISDTCSGPVPDQVPTVLGHTSGATSAAPTHWSMRD